MKRWFASVSMILLLGAPGAQAAEKKPPADTKPQQEKASDEAEKKPATQPHPPAPNEDTTGKSPAPNTPANTTAGKAKPNSKATATAANKPGATSTGKAAPGDTATTGPSTQPAPIDRKDLALLRDLEMLLLLEILNNYEMFEGVRE